MDLEQALAVVEQACPLAPLPLAQHRLIQQALATIRAHVTPNPEPVEGEVGLRGGTG